MAADEDVYCTLVMNDAYLPGAAVLAHSLRDCGTQKKLACMVLQDSLSLSSIQELQSLYNYVIPIERIGNPSPANLYLMNRPDLLYAFTKIHAWRMTQFRKLVYLDADIVVLRAPEELFDIEESFAAAPDVGWPDAFNTGVMVISPHVGDYYALRGMAQAGDSFDGADQGLINQYYEHRPWKRISFTYNTTPSANYQYEPAYRYYKRDISMVHFIGPEKPWARGRTVDGASGAFQEMLSRWWAVYDRHFKVSTHDYVQGGKQPIQYYVNEGGQQQQHQPSQSDNYYVTGYPVESTQPAPPPQIFVQHFEPIYEPPPTYPMPIGAPSGGSSTPPMTEPGERAENIGQGIVQPTSTVEQRRFSAPHMEWDATRAAPPSSSRPEAVNFPRQVYEFNRDPEPFRPPHAYPEPPRDMWYKVPEKPKPEEKLKILFPWEEREMSKPTRRFVEDQVPPQPEPAPVEARPAYADELEVEPGPVESPVTPTIKVVHANPWDAFVASKNAWDEDSGIDSYVRRLTAFQRNRGKVQVLSSTKTPAGVLSPSSAPNPDDLVAQVEKRRESLILTDFPTAFERPSLPVTPAPTRPTFWGEERDDESHMPQAEGVPGQDEWNPSTQLENLRRNSLLATDLKLPPRKNIPQRQMPPTAAPIPEEVLTGPHVPPSASLPSTEDIRASIQQAELIPLSGASSPHGLDGVADGRYFNGHDGQEPGLPTTATVPPTADSSAIAEPSSFPNAQTSALRTSAFNSSPTATTSPAYDILTSASATNANTAFNKATTTAVAQKLFSEPGFHRPSTVDEIDQARQEGKNMASHLETSGLVSPTSLEPEETPTISPSVHADRGVL